MEEMESKYIIGESYSGNDEVRIQGKVGDLEKKAAFDDGTTCFAA